MNGGVGGWSGRSVQQVDDRRGHRLAGVGQEDADLPHLGVAELSFEGGHAGEADTVLDLPMGFADWIVADADNFGVVAMRFKQGRCIGIHMLTDGGVAAVKAMADRAPFNINVCPGGEIGWIGLHVRAHHFPLDAGIEREMHNALFVGKRGVVHSNWNLAVREVSQDRQGNNDDTDDQPKQESKHGVRSLRPVHPRVFESD